jgi:hypothetical protein
MFKVGDKVSFHSIEENFDWVHDVERYLDDVTEYEIVEIPYETNDIIKVRSKDGSTIIPVDIDEYQIHTQESLRQLLTLRNHKYAAICNKIKQLYRKQEFQFQGV